MLSLWRRGKHYCWTFPFVLFKVWRDSLRATLPTPRQAGSYRGEWFSSMGDLHSKQPCIPIQDHSWSAELWRRRGRGNQSLSDTVRRQGLEREACDMRSFASLRVAVRRGGGERRLQLQVGQSFADDAYSRFLINCPSWLSHVFSNHSFF